MKKKLALLLATTLLVGSLAACGSNEKTPAVETNTATPVATPVATEEPDSGTVAKPEGYPTKSIDFIVPAAAGSAMDLPTRVLVEALELGDKPVVVVNSAGGTQTIGTQAVYKAQADGHTLLAVGNGGLMIMPAIKDLPYTIDDFRHLSLMSPPDPMTIVVKADSPYKTYADLEKDLKAGVELNYSAGNPNGIGDIGGKMWLQAIGVEHPTYVPYTSTTECVPALLGGHVDFLVLDNGVATNLVKDGSVRMLAMFSDERTEAMPDVPTLKEMGIDVETYGYKWVAVHKDTPDDVVAWIKQQVDLAIASDAYQQFMITNYGAAVEQVTEEEMTQIVKDNYEMNKALAEELGIKAQ